jgi:hypothetical protein
MRALMRQAIDVALPPLCPSCRAPLGEGTGLGAECWAKLAFIEPPFCARLGIPFTYDPGPELLSMEAIASPPALRPRPRRSALRGGGARWWCRSNTATGSIWRPCWGAGWRALAAS